MEIILTENNNSITFQEAISKIKKGDVLELNTDKKEHYNIIASSGQEIIVQKNGQTYLLRKNAYHNKKIDFFIKGDKDFNKRGHIDNIRFIRILRNNKPIMWILDSDNKKEKESIEKDLKNQVRIQANRVAEFKGVLDGLKLGDSLTIKTGLINKDGTINEKSVTEINFAIMWREKNYKYYLEYIDSKGINSKNYNIFEDMNDLLITSESATITSHEDTIKLTLINNGKKYNINNVVGVESEKKDMSNVITKDDIMNNKNFRDAMIKDASWLRKFFGTNIPKGIIPARERLLNKSSNNVSNIDRRIKRGNRVLFRLLSSDLSIEDVELSNEKKYFGRVKEDFSFKVPLESKKIKAYANFKIINNDKFRENVYNVTINMVKDGRGFNDVNKEYKGKIQIIDYNY